MGGATAGIVIGSVGGDLSLQAGGDSAAGKRRLTGGAPQFVGRSTLRPPGMGPIRYHALSRDRAFRPVMAVATVSLWLVILDHLAASWAHWLNERAPRDRGSGSMDNALAIGVAPGGEPSVGHPAVAGASAGRIPRRY